MISTHILDLQSGLPAIGVSVQLEQQSGNAWSLVKDEVTNADGRINFDIAPEVGTFRLNFKIEEYLKDNGSDAFFVAAPVIFKISDTHRKYHIPLLLSPFGYSTYRGS